MHACILFFLFFFFSVSQFAIAVLIVATYKFITVLEFNAIL